MAAYRSGTDHPSFHFLRVSLYLLCNPQLPPEKIKSCLIFRLPDLPPPNPDIFSRSRTYCHRHRAGFTATVYHAGPPLVICFFYRRYSCRLLFYSSLSEIKISQVHQCIPACNRGKIIPVHRGDLSLFTE